MIECNYDESILKRRYENGYVSKLQYKRLYNSHMSLESCIKFLKANDLSRLKEVYLMHLSDKNSNEQGFKRKNTRNNGVYGLCMPKIRSDDKWQKKECLAKKITRSDAFLSMPTSARLLYYDLSMDADDDGFVDRPKSIMKLTGASDDDLSILIAKSFVIPFENGVCH